jgi:GxxExxY protein
MHENEVSRKVIGCAIEVHRTLGGPGLLERVYEEALAWELNHRGLRVERQVRIPIVYKEVQLAAPLVVDLIVERRVVVEVKAVTVYNPVFEAQALTYLRLLGLRLALVINFGEPAVRDGIHRVANNLEQDN